MAPSSGHRWSTTTRSSNCAESQRHARSSVELLEEKKVEINAPLEMKDELLRMFHPEVHFNIVLMTVGRGELRPKSTVACETLIPEDAPDIARLLREADPKWWGDMSEERVQRDVQQILLARHQGRGVPHGRRERTDPRPRVQHIHHRHGKGLEGEGVCDDHSLSFGGARSLRRFPMPSSMCGRTTMSPGRSMRKWASNPT